MMQLIPAWVFFACALAPGGAVYLGLMFSLACTAHPVYAAVAKSGYGCQRPCPAQGGGATATRIARNFSPVFLAPEIRAGGWSVFMMMAGVLKYGGDQGCSHPAVRR
ncbi:MAG: hypothetical protein R3E89_17025 [Thiolinea sp.]